MAFTVSTQVIRPSNSARSAGTISRDLNKIRTGAIHRHGGRRVGDYSVSLVQAAMDAKTKNSGSLFQNTNAVNRHIRAT